MRRTLWTVRSPSGLVASCSVTREAVGQYMLSVTWSGRPLVRERYATVGDALVHADVIQRTLLEQCWEPDSGSTDR
jgi:hypothetical protein